MPSKYERGTQKLVILLGLLITALNEIKDSNTLADLEGNRVQYLGQKGKITAKLKLLA